MITEQQAYTALSTLISLLGIWWLVDALIRLWKENKQARYPLRGSVIKYDGPLDPVGEEDWDLYSDEWGISREESQ